MAEQLLLTCEHGGNRVPRQYAKLFQGKQRLLETHRGYDAGALELAQCFSERLDAPLIHATVTRLLIDLNRSLHHRKVFSEFTAMLSAVDRAAIVRDHYLPYREQVAQSIEQQMLNGRVVHVSLHTFTPMLDGKQRTAEIGLLYDSRREREAAFCLAWRDAIHLLQPNLRVRRNYPYLGKADGFTATLRRHYGDDRYLGVELEVSRGLWRPKARAWRKLQDDLAAALALVLHSRSDASFNLPQGPPGG